MIVVCRGHRFGFSLIEVNLAIFVIGLGMLTLFSLFPTGLRQVEDSQKVTQEALFADYVLSTIRANAVKVPAGDWVDSATLPDSLMKNLPIDAGTNVQEVTSFPTDASDQPMKAQIEIDRITTNRWGITLWCRAGDGEATDYSVETGSKN